MKLKLKRKKHFFFGYKRKIGKIYIRNTFSNVIVTLTDLLNRVIICKSSGSSGIKGSKRLKKAPQVIENIMLKLRVFFRLYKIKYIFIVLKMRVVSHVHYLLNELYYYGIYLLGITIRRKIAHNGVKGRKLRRV